MKTNRRDLFKMLGFIGLGSMLPKQKDIIPEYIQKYESNHIEIHGKVGEFMLSGTYNPKMYERLS